MVTYRLQSKYKLEWNFQIGFPDYDLINIMSSNMYLKFESE